MCERRVRDDGIAEAEQDSKFCAAYLVWLARVRRAVGSAPWIDGALEEAGAEEAAAVPGGTQEEHHEDEQVEVDARHPAWRRD